MDDAPRPPIPEATWRALLHPGHPDEPLAHLYRHLAATHGAGLHVGQIEGLDVTVDLRRDDTPPRLVRLTPPRHAREVIVRHALSGSRSGFAIAMVGKNVHAEAMNTGHPGLLLLRAARIALSVAPPGPLTLLHDWPELRRTLLTPDPRSREHLLFSREHVQRGDPTELHLIRPTLARSAALPDEVMFGQEPPRSGRRTRAPQKPDVRAAPEAARHRVQMQVTCQGERLIIQAGPSEFTAPREPHVPDTITALNAVLPHLPERTRLLVTLPASAAAALEDPERTLGAHAHVARAVKDLLSKRQIDLRSA